MLEELIDQEMHALCKDEWIVEQELKFYINNGVSDTAEHLSDLTQKWEHNEHSYPLLFHVTMDVLPVQASAVSCEQVFSSKALQMLKFSFKQERLNFTGDLIADEKDYTIVGLVTGTAVLEFLEAGKLQELEELLSNTYDTF
ncbi:hypothetical protein H0H87_011408 [Tephrocybe sp. NHM501043]|nr:hypothetical protein H0H87_011408 [Tephrocybe sp. NHM501043]